ncbi:hypothetical protein FZW96_19750 [Bacillus sp. BGMRC 2118]|nr:hypothetical protein FZW96_19750 [Bacillus sp. BGMRC 2118]
MHEIIKKNSEIRDKLLNPSNEVIVWDEFQLNEDEQLALKKINFDEITLTAIEKILRDSILGAFHTAFSLLDAVGDPELIEVEDVWLGLRLIEPKENEDEDYSFLHDEVYSSYWSWLEQKSN